MALLRPERIRPLRPFSLSPLVGPAVDQPTADSPSVADRLFTPFLRAELAVADFRCHSLPRPRDSPRGHAAGADEQRILLIGTGLAVGWGVATHELALPGALARAVTARTGRGCTVDVVAEPEMTLEGGLEALTSAHAGDYDAIVIMVGLLEAVRRTPRDDWARSLDELLAAADACSARETPVLVTGIQPISSISILDSWAAARIQVSADLLNETTRARIELHPSLSYLALELPDVARQPPADDRYRSPEDYAAWGGLLANAVLPRLDAAAGAHTRKQSSVPRDEAKRQAAVDDVTRRGSFDTRELDRITSLARQAFGTKTAMLTIIDGDTQRCLASDGDGLDDVPRADAFCSVTIQGRDAVVVLDALEDARFRDKRTVTEGPRVRFYAGYPVQSPSGDLIGALCVVDPEPRTSDDAFDDGFLRELALLAQRELWRRCPRVAAPEAPATASVAAAATRPSRTATREHLLATPTLAPLSRLVMAQRYRALPKRTDAIPRPRDEGHGRAGTTGGHRILVVGNDYAVSWGVRSHDLGLPGQLANELSQRTGLGAEVDVVVDTGLSLESLRVAIAGRDLSSYDSIVVLGGVGDAVRLLPLARWEQDVDALVGELSAVTVETTRITLCGIEPASSLSFCQAREHGLADEWAESLNAISEAFCATRPRVDYFAPVALPLRALDPTDELRYRAPSVHRAWARRLSRHLVPLLNEPRDLAPERTVDVDQSVERRLEALETLGILYTPPEPRFSQIVRRARDLFLTEAAAFSLLSDRHQWNKALSGATATEYPLEVSFCALAITAEGPFLVEDAWQDPRIPFDTFVRFYAGVPISAPDGTRIGALCVFDAEPRDASTVDTRYLRELADEIEEELRGRPTV